MEVSVMLFFMGKGGNTLYITEKKAARALALTALEHITQKVR